MLRVSRLTDYGIVLLAHLAERAERAERAECAERGGDVHNARELAEEAGLPLPVVSKLLKGLTRHGFLQSHRGAKGGYALARPAREIPVVEVIDALEGPIALTECSAQPGSCDREASCVVRAPWQRINRAVRASLEEVRLSDLVDAPPAQPAAIPEEQLLTPRP